MTNPPDEWEGLEALAREAYRDFGLADIAVGGGERATVSVPRFISAASPSVVLRLIAAVRSGKDEGSSAKEADTHRVAEQPVLGDWPGDSYRAIARELNETVEHLICGLPDMLKAGDLKDEEGLIEKAANTLDVTAFRLAQLDLEAAETPDPTEPVEAAVVGWQPIETAPKDGTRVLLFSVPNEVPSLRPHIADGFWKATSSLMAPGFWMLGQSVGPSFCPTHWQPLPPAPDAKEPAQ
jgi:hypothetical protein